MKRLPKVIELEELKKLDTKRLLSYLKLLHQCEESFEKSDQDINTDLVHKDRIEFKQSEKWKLAYNRTKSILNKREHIDN